MAGFDPTFGASGASHVGGSVPDPGSVAGTSRYLREDAIWAVPNAGPPGPPAPSPGPALDQWACNVAGFIIYELCYKLVKAVVDTNFFTLATNAIIAFVFDSLAEILIPLEIVDPAFITWLESTLSPAIIGSIATFEAHLLDQVLWSKFHCFLYNEIRTAGTLSNTVLLAAGIALAASGISPSQVTNGVALILQQFGIMTVGPVPASAFVQNYDCTTCAGTGTSSAPIPIQSTFDLTVTDGTNTATNVNVLQVNHGIVGGDGNTATLTPEVGVDHNGSSVGVEPALDFVDSGSVSWTLTDDPSGSKVLVSATGASGTVTGVTASSPLASSGGSAPDISLSGIVAANNGGLGIDTSAAAKGDILVNTGSAWARVGAGSDGQALIADSSLADGVKWASVPGGSGGGLTLLAVAEVTGSPSSTIVVSVGSGFSHLYFVILARSTQSGTDLDRMYCRLNNDSSASYNWETGWVSTTVSSAEEGISGNQAGMFYMPASTSPANHVGSFEMWLFDYTNANWYKNAHWRNHLPRQFSSGNVYASYGAFEWANTAAVTQLTFFPGLGQFAVHSKIFAYGVA